MADLLPLFSTPVYFSNIDKSIVGNLPEIEFQRMDGDNAWSSKNKYVLEIPELQNLKKAIEEKLREYIFDLLKVETSVEFYITNSWVNVHNTGDRILDHHHNNSLFSGIYYIETTSTSGQIIFKNPESRIFPSAIDILFTENNLFNSRAMPYTPNIGDIIIFPSTLAHAVTKSESATPRTILAFNVFARGTFGHPHKLELK